MAVVILGFVALVCSLVPIASAQADEFSWELSGFFSETDVSGFFESSRTSIGGTYYFDPVDDASGPYALASFFDPATRMSASVSRNEQDVPVATTLPGTSASPPGVESEAKDYSLGGRYLLPRSKWYAGGHYTRGDVDLPETDLKAYGLLVGKYLGRATTLELAVGSSRSDSEAPRITCIFGLICFNSGLVRVESTTDSAALTVRHVRRFRSLTYSLSGEITETTQKYISYVLPVIQQFPILPPLQGIPSAGGIASPFESEFGPLRAYSVAGELFPTAKLGVRLGYSRFDGDSSDDDAYELATTWFFRRNVGLQFSFSGQRQEASSLGDTDGAVLRVIGRL